MIRLVRGALPVMLAVIEFGWLYPWVLLLTGTFYGPAPAALLPPAAAFALLALAFAVVRVALAQPWSLRSARVMVVGTGIIAGLAAVKRTYYASVPGYDVRWLAALVRAVHDVLPAVPPPAMAALLATLLWWRGIVLGEREFTHVEVERAFRRGVGWTVLFIAFFALYSDTRGFALTRSAPAYLLVFFASGLLMLAVTRLLAIWQENQADAGQALAANRHWLLLLLGVVGLILSGASVIAGLLNIEFRPLLLRWLRPLEPVVEVVFLALFAVALVIAKGILFVFSRLPWRPGGLQPPATLQQPLAVLLQDLPPRVVSGARWGVVIAVVALLILAVAIAVVRARRRVRRGDEDERESVWDGRSLLAGMGRAWRALWGRVLASPPGRDSGASTGIRAVYRDLLRVGADLGVARRHSETPFEYRPRLTARLPHGATDIAALTAAYVLVRYSPQVPTDDEVAEARQTMDRIRVLAVEPPQGGGSR